MTDPTPDRLDLADEPTPNSEGESSSGTAPGTSRKKKISFKKRWVFFGVLAVIFVSVYCLVNVDSISTVFKRLGEVLSPLFIGCFIAYLCNPILKFYEYLVFRKLGKGNLRLGLSLLCTFLTLFGIIAVILAMIIPELYKSISHLIGNYEESLNGLLGFVQSIINKLPAEITAEIDISDVDKLMAFIEDVFGDAEQVMNNVLEMLKGYVFEGDLIGNIWNVLSKVFGTIVDFFLGLVIAFYILSSKEKRLAQINKFRAAYLNDKQDGKLSEIVTLVDKTFGGFFKGVLVDALVVGVLMFIGLSIFSVSEYNLLIAIICAITNIIPVFGPLIGAIPSALIVLISNPEKLIVFILIVLVIQQIDGNILVPLIQGNNTGISSLAVLVSITVMGGFFGIGGMVIGVPVFAVVIELVKRAIEDKLRKQDKETDTTHYYRKGAIGNAEEEVYYEHAHLKYKYDHSKIKPHVDKVLAAFARIGKKDEDEKNKKNAKGGKGQKDKNKKK